jgi:dUTPase
MVTSNVGFNDKHGYPPKLEDNIFTFVCAKPMIIQSKEIKRVLTDVTLEIEPGFILTVFTEAGISEKAAQVFPGPYVLDSSTPKKVLEIPVQNLAGSPLHLMEGQIIAKGYLTQVAEVQIKEIEPVQGGRQKMERTTPQKKNTDVKFEVK